MKSPTNKKPDILKARNSSPALKDEDIPGSYPYFFISFAALLLLLNILFQNGLTGIVITRAWGLNNFSYFPWWVQALVFAFLFAIGIPFVNNFFRLFILKHIPATFRKIGKIFWFTLISLFITLLFYLFRVKYDLLGDMNLRVSQTVEGKYVTDEYLTMYIMHYLNILLHTLFHFTPRQTFVFASIAAGFSYCFLGLLIADLLFETIYSIIIFFLFSISIGTVLIFCGYTEIYAVPAASASLYMFTAFLYLKKKVTIILPLLCLVLAVAFHKEQISLLPSFVFLITRKFKVINNLNVKLILTLFLISIPLIYLLNAILHLQSLMPLTRDKQFPELDTLFSFSYWWESFNAQYVSSGILIFLFVLILFKAIKAQIQLDDYSKFMLIAVLFIYSIIITMNKERGSGDWDVCSFPAIYLSMFVAYILLAKFDFSSRKGFYIISAVLVLNSFNCMAWIGLNSREKSLNKIEDMLLTDPGWYYKVKLPPEMELSIIFNNYGTQDKAMKYYRLSYEEYGNTNITSRFNYIHALMDARDTDKAIPILLRSVKDVPYFLDSYNFLFDIFNGRKEYNKVYNLSRYLDAVYDKNPNYMLNNQNNKNLLINTLAYLYRTSLARNDTATYRHIGKEMEQLHIQLRN